MSLEDSILELASAIRYAADRLVPTGPPKPQPFTYKLISERTTDQMDILTYEATLPTVPDGTDVASQTLTISTDGAVAETKELDKDIVTVTFDVPQGANVDLSLTYTDDAGNVSAPRNRSWRWTASRRVSRASSARSN